MTRQEIQALIDAKIKGQGTAVDAGSVLPAILTGILDLIEQGGGGGTADAVQYIPQELTGAQQMQARKNQGLYYSEGGGDVTINWDGDTTGLETVGGLYKISEDAPSASEVKSVSMIQNGVGQTYEVGVAPAQIVELDGGYAIGSLACLVITADEVSVQGTTYTKGVWFVYGNENNRTSQLVYGQTETIQHIEPKYIKDMYYEETNEEEKTVFTPDDPNYEWQYPDNYWLYGGLDFGWICADTPTQEDIISIRFSDSEDYIQGSELSSTIIEREDVEGGPIILYEVNSSDSARKKFFVVMEDAFIGGLEPKKGIYVPKLEMYADPYIAEINYNGTTTTIHQVPQKYLPSGGLQTYDIDVEWSELNNIINAGYGYINWGSADPEAAFDEVCQALADGKMVALNIGRGSFGFPGGKLLSGNFVPLNKQNEDGDFASIVFKVYWPTYNPNTGTLISYSEQLIRLVFHEGIETGEWSITVKAEAVTV